MDCRFCQFDNIENKVIDHDSVILSSESYYSISSVGGFLPGWVLVCPQNHDVNLINHYDNSAFWDMCENMEQALSHTYSENVTIFEHGPSLTGSLTGCGVNHAHIHLLPLNFSLEEEVKVFDPSLKWEKVKSSEINEIVNGREYLFISDNFNSSNTEGLLHILEQPISQFFRQVIASKINKIDIFDYKTHPHYESTDETSQKLCDFFERTHQLSVAI